MNEWTDAVRRYFDQRNQAWVSQRLDPVREAAAADAHPAWWADVRAGFERMHYAVRRRGSRLLRAHTRIRLHPLQGPGDGAGTGEMITVRIDERITWVYQDGPGFGVESRTVEHRQRWVRRGGRWCLDQAWEADERIGLHPGAGARGLAATGSETAQGGLRDWPEFHTSRACTRFDRVRAQRYADLWWNGYHPGFVRLEDDCTNFASQCLFAGRLPMRASGTRAAGWWYRFPSGGRPAQWSFSWTTSHALYLYLVNQAGAREVADPRELRVGDVIFYDWAGNGRFHHSTIVTDFNHQGDPLVNAHTTPSFHRHFRYLDSRAWTPRTRYAFVRMPDEFCPDM
ncbi:amidase domain-containing protein [Alicyclobacillus macrosporangiidus]|uniref:Putative amidase domain-containing protein n=1 Tax=Alicyclobacillus macrosporangiidus TaxID=392015 RepID=A0A1I7K3A5_9BACL|nr:amidase domain-containing protein [Alicyclobacillus macrosporangiidus]SFU91879.1 Putative amidase domain-containing protein [Alicyclobacillus macrosporangiidus]